MKKTIALLLALVLVLAAGCAGGGVTAGLASVAEPTTSIMYTSRVFIKSMVSLL